MKTTIIAIAAVAMLALAGACSDDERNQKIEAATSPQEFISLEINEPKANVEVRRIKDSLLVTYDLVDCLGSRPFGQLATDRR
jgi:hypothetical protein